MERVTILDDYQSVALHSADWSPVQRHFHVESITRHIASTDELTDRLADSTIIVAMRERTAITAEILEKLPRLQLLVTTGMRNAAIDVTAAKAKGIMVCGTGWLDSPMPEITIGMMIALMRNFVAEDASVRAGGWQQKVGVGLAGRTLGIVGLGRVGVPVAALAAAMQMKVIAWSPHLTPERAASHGVTCVTKEELFASADVVSIHMPLVRETTALIGARELAQMRPDAYLINTSRGPIVDEAALVDVLTTGRLAGAGLDVYDQEPLPRDHPLRSLPNTLVLPHIGYVTTDVYAVFYRDIVEDIVAWHEGKSVRPL